MRVHFSTLIALFLATSAFLGLQFIPILRLSQITEHYEEVFSTIGWGWPSLCVDTQEIYWQYLLLNALILLFILTWLYFQFQKPLKLRPAYLVFCIAITVFWFLVAILAAAGPVISAVSFSLMWKPWWQNWRSTLFVFLFSMIGISILNRCWNWRSDLVEWMADRQEV